MPGRVYDIFHLPDADFESGFEGIGDIFSVEAAADDCSQDSWWLVAEGFLTVGCSLTLGKPFYV
jgi:hypothetical protein